MTWLLDTNGFMPRMMCGQWSNALILAYVVPSIIIALCYWWIPFNGLIYWKNHRDGLGQHKGILIWYSYFIFFCGITHVFDILIFKWPIYHFNIIILNLAAIFSLKAAWHTKSFIRDHIRLPSRTELHDALDQAWAEKLNKECALIEKDRLILKQNEAISRLQNLIDTQVWLVDKEKAISELKSIVERMHS